VQRTADTIARQLIADDIGDLHEFLLDIEDSLLKVLLIDDKEKMSFAVFSLLGRILSYVADESKGDYEDNNIRAMYEVIDTIKHAFNLLM
jgi:hypothetical protein